MIDGLKELSKYESYKRGASKLVSLLITFLNILR